jgi:NADPH:quinone reductase-like Zn-dependent oxidoreductase
VESGVEETVGMRGIPSSMRAAVVRAFGGPEVVRIVKNVPVPRLAPDEVLVRVAAASVSPLDARVRAGYARAVYAPMLPLILGRDVSGEVVARGDNARTFPVGSEVFGALSPVAPRGAHAEFVAISEAHLAKKPEHWTHTQAACVPFAALTAWRALFTDADLKKGDRLLIAGLGSSVGGFAAQLALARGASAVCGSVGSRSRDRVHREIGIPRENMWTYDSTWSGTGEESNTGTGEESNTGTGEDPSPPTSLLSACKKFGWSPFDVAFDAAGGLNAERGLAKSLRRGNGRLVTVHGDLAKFVGEEGVVFGAAKAAREFARKKIMYRVSDDIRYSWSVMRQDSEAMAAIAKYARDGTLRPPPIFKTFSLIECAEAHSAMESDAPFSGKIVLEVP